MAKDALLIIGCGFTGKALAKKAIDAGLAVHATNRTPQADMPEGVHSHLMDLSESPEKNAVILRDLLSKMRYAVISVPPKKEGDQLMPIHQNLWQAWLDENPQHWVGYLSTTGVYGNHDGAWVNEQTPASPSMPRTKLRLATEQAWLLLQQSQRPWQVSCLRLAGIYGSGRNAINKLQAGHLRRIDKPGQMFSRIHCEDAAAAILAVMAEAERAPIYNVADDYPCPPQEVITYAAEQLGIELPPMTPFEDADLTPMQRSFYEDNKRIDNSLIKQLKGFSLTYPTYKEGLQFII